MVEVMSLKCGRWKCSEVFGWIRVKLVIALTVFGVGEEESE